MFCIFLNVLKISLILQNRVCTNVSCQRRVEVGSVRLLFNACMLLGMLLPMLCIWADCRHHDSGRSVLRWKLWRKLLFVLPPGHADTIRRCTPRSDICGIHHTTSRNADALPVEVCNQKEAQDTGRRLRGLCGSLVLFLLCACAGPALDVSVLYNFLSNIDITVYVICDLLLQSS